MPDNADTQQFVMLAPGPQACRIHVYLLRIEKSRGQLDTLLLLLESAAASARRLATELLRPS